MKSNSHHESRGDRLIGGRRWLSVAWVIAGLVGSSASAVRSQSEPVSGQSPFPCSDAEIAHYTAYRTAEPIRVDGKLDEPVWRRVVKSPRFVDILSGERTLFDTRAAVVWDDANLYIAFWVEDPLVSGTLTRRDAPIYTNNDVEVFIAGKDAYYEFEINALGTIYEVFFIWQDAYESGGFSDSAEFERGKIQGFNGVGFKNHPRGKRWGAFGWDFPGLQTGVDVDGTLNNDRDRDRGWTVELAFPWKGMVWLAKADQRSLPPEDGDVWRIDFSRFNQFKEAPPARDSGGWFWSPHGVWDSHIPECFPYVHFSTKPVE